MIVAVNRGNTVQTKFGSEKRITSSSLLLAHFICLNRQIWFVNYKVVYPYGSNLMRSNFDLLEFLQSPITHWSRNIRLLKTDGIAIEFAESGIEALAEIAAVVNEKPRILVHADYTRR